ncbi:MAG: glycosyltransferase family 39 protein [Deltaproteobacteria bacterium]|nr:glycosyltransferase family 39 protein [Deltaproteobacteria bacterium]
MKRHESSVWRPQGASTARKTAGDPSVAASPEAGGWRVLARRGGENAERLLLLFQAAVVARLLFLAVTRSFDHDELEAVHSAWKILHGERIYVDFLNQHHPLFYYVLAPIIALLGEGSGTIVVLRVAMVGVLVFILVVTYKIARLVFDRETAVVSTLFLSTALVFTQTAMEIRPDVPQALCGVAAVFFLLRFFERRALRDLAVSGLMFGVSFLFLQKVLLLIVPAQVLLLWCVYKRDVRWLEVGVHLGFLALPLLVYAAYVLAAGSGRSYVDCCWLINYRWNRNVTVVRNLSQSSAVFGSLQVNPALWGGYLFGAIFFAETPLRRRLTFLSIGVLAATFVRKPLAQDLILAVPLASVVSAHAVRSLLNDKVKLLVAVALSIALPSLVLAFGEYRDNRAQRQKIDYVLSIARAAERVYDGDIRFNVFRKDIDFAWFSVRPGGALDIYRALTGYRYDVYAAIDRMKPAVISEYGLSDPNDPRISHYYVRSPRYDDLLIRAR